MLTKQSPQLVYMVLQCRELRPGDVGYRQHASRPEALPLDFVRRPESKVDPEVARNRARQQRQDERRMKVNEYVSHFMSNFHFSSCYSTITSKTPEITIMPVL